MAADERGTIVYESPRRIATTLADLADACGSDRPAAVCRELTKRNEEIVRGSLGELAERARTGKLTLRGEFTLVVGWSAGAARTSPLGAADGESALATAKARV
jgi:16S rRNA (cytidine1402-2'-O)-methyltransferase